MTYALLLEARHPSVSEYVVVFGTDFTDYIVLLLCTCTVCHYLSLSPFKKPKDLRLYNLRHSISEKINYVRSSVPGPPPASQVRPPRMSFAMPGVARALRAGLTSGLRHLSLPQLSLNIDQAQPRSFQQFYLLNNGDMLSGVASA